MELEPEAIDWLLFTSTAEQINELTELAWWLRSRGEETVTVTVYKERNRASERGACSCV